MICERTATAAANSLPCLMDKKGPKVVWKYFTFQVDDHDVVIYRHEPLCNAVRQTEAVAVRGCLRTLYKIHAESLHYGSSSRQTKRRYVSWEPADETRTLCTTRQVTECVCLGDRRTPLPALS